MGIIESAGLGTPLQSAGAPSAGTDEIQTLTFTDITGGSFMLSFDGYKTTPINWSATNNTLVANIDAALEALPNIGTGGVTTAVGTMTAGIGTITVTFVGNNAKKNVALMTVDYAAILGTGATVACATTTPGVDATGRCSPKGAKLIDTTNGIDYINTGSPLGPTWTKVGTQT